MTNDVNIKIYCHRQWHQRARKKISKRRNLLSILGVNWSQFSNIILLPVTPAHTHHRRHHHEHHHHCHVVVFRLLRGWATCKDICLLSSKLPHTHLFNSLSVFVICLCLFYCLAACLSGMIVCLDWLSVCFYIWCYSMFVSLFILSTIDLFVFVKGCLHVCLTLFVVCMSVFMSGCLLVCPTIFIFLTFSCLTISPLSTFLLVCLSYVCATSTFSLLLFESKS